MDTAAVFGTGQPIVGMVHCRPLPGAPQSTTSLGEIKRRAVADAETLADGGVDAVLVENFGDAPFYPDRVPRHVVASMTAVVDSVAAAVDVPVGVNVLRNDGQSAVAIAAATATSFVRVNVHTGARVTDQGIVEGSAHETLRLRKRLDTDVAILADVAVKHSQPIGAGEGRDPVGELLERGMADGIVVSGTATGDPVDREFLEFVCARRDETDPAAPVLVGSGVRPETVGSLLEDADGAIVGTALKSGGEIDNPVDEDRVARLVATAASGIGD